MNNNPTTITALKRGLFCRCPNCGKGKIFSAFLKTSDICPSCGEEIHHHRADDLPAYCVIIIAGHFVLPLMLLSMAYTAWPNWVHLSIWLPSFLIISVALLQPVKGAIIALQWAVGMHGFSAAKKRRNNRQEY